MFNFVYLKDEMSSKQAKVVEEATEKATEEAVEETTKGATEDEPFKREPFRGGLQAGVAD